MVEQFRAFLKSEGVLLAVIPIVCVLLSLAFEYGVSFYYGFPEWLLDADLKTTLYSIIRVSLTALVGLMFFVYVLRCVESKNFILRLLGVAMFHGRYVFYIAIIMDVRHYSWTGPLVVTACFILLYCAYAGWLAIGDKAFSKHFVRFVDEQSSHIVEKTTSQLKDRVTVAIRLVIGLPILFFMGGVASCTFSQYRFVTDLKNPDGQYAVVRRYGDTLVLAEVDKAAKQLTKRFRLIQVPDTEGLLFEETKEIKSH